MPLVLKPLAPAFLEAQGEKAKGISSSSRVPAAVKASRRDSPSRLTPREAVKEEKMEPKEPKERLPTLIGKVMHRAGFSR